MELIIIVSCSLLLIMSILSVYLLIKNKKLKKKIKVLSISLIRVEDLVNLKHGDSKDSDVHKENFIKFLSDSRDWAYQYIEDVQNGLTVFVSRVDADISHFDEYGETLSMARPDYAAMKNISKAYKELKELLPAEE